MELEFLQSVQARVARIFFSWETLIPAVYGVSASDFEQGWQAYLVAHCGLSLDSIVK